MKNIFLFLSILLIPQLVSAHTVGPSIGGLIIAVIVIALFVVFLSYINPPNFFQAWIIWKVLYIIVPLLNIFIFKIIGIIGMLVVLYFALRKPKDSSNQSTHSLNFLSITSNAISALIIVVLWVFIGNGISLSMDWDGWVGLLSWLIVGIIAAIKILNVSKTSKEWRYFLKYLNSIILIECVIVMMWPNLWHTDPWILVVIGWFIWIIWSNFLLYINIVMNKIK